jgi:hypothetical protein
VQQLPLLLLMGILKRCHTQKFSVMNVNGNSRCILRNAVTTSEIVGAKDVEGADRLQAQVSASPSERWLWAIAGMSYDPGVTSVTVTIEVRVSYYAEFFDRKVVTQSLYDDEKSEFTKFTRPPALKQPSSPFTFVAPQESKKNSRK